MNEFNNQKKKIINQKKFTNEKKNNKTKPQNEAVLCLQFKKNVTDKAILNIA